MNIDIAILGGMGPQAGANYFKILTDLFSTEKGDQEHPQVLLYSNSKIPDRAQSIDSNNDAPFEKLKSSLSYLNSLNPKIINIACNSVHHWIYKYNLEKEFSNILTIDGATGQYLNIVNDYQDFILFGTTATTNTDFYFNTFKNYGLNLLKPTDSLQDKISNSINEIKKNNFDNSIKLMKDVLKELENKKFLIACTELSLIKKHLNLNHDQYIDSSHCLAVMTYIKYSNIQINKSNLLSAYKKLRDINLVLND